MSPALTDLPYRVVAKALMKSGFDCVRVSGSHAVYRNSDGRIVVVPEHTTIKRGTLASILRQAGLTVTEFKQLL